MDSDVLMIDHSKHERCETCYTLIVKGKRIKIITEMEEEE
jgi:hypothetical protein